MSNRRNGVGEERSINWEWAHLASEDKPGPNGRDGFFLGSKIHWQLGQSQNHSGAQLVSIGGKEVKDWEHAAIKAYLDQFLRDDDGPKERILTFINGPFQSKKTESTKSVISRQSVDCLCSDSNTNTECTASTQ